MNIIKKIFIGFCAALFSVMTLINAHGSLYFYEDALKSSGIMAVVYFVVGTIYLVVSLGILYMVGDVIELIRDIYKNEKEKEE